MRRLFKLTTICITYNVASIVVYVLGVANISASEITVVVTCVVEGVVHDSYVYAIEVVTFGVALIAIYVRCGSDRSAEITVDVTIVCIYVNISVLTAYVAIGVACVIIYVLSGTVESAYVTLCVTIVIEAVRGLAIEAAYVTLGIAGVGKFVSNVSYVIASVALGITVVIEGVKTFPRSDKSDRFRGCIGIKVPSTSVRKGPAKEFVTVLFRNRKFTVCITI